MAMAPEQETRLNGALGDIGIHIVDFTSYGSGLDVAHVFRPAENLRQGAWR